MVSLLDDFYADNIDVEVGNSQITFPVIGDEGFLRSYETISADRVLEVNKSYDINGLARLNLILPEGVNGDRVNVFVSSLAGFRLTSNTRIQHNMFLTLVGGYIDSMMQGTHITFERSAINWIAVVQAGYIDIR